MYKSYTPSKMSNACMFFKRDDMATTYNLSFSRKDAT